MATNCWRLRGCPDEMKETCLFWQKNRKCPLSCKFAMCENKSQIDPLDYFDLIQHQPDPDDETVRNECQSCQRYYIFLKKKYPTKSK